MSAGSVQVIESPGTIAAWATDTRRAGQRIAFVPTMGALHAGHVALLEEGRRRGDRLALSIFVNPTQFAPHEDLARYPRDLEGDLAKAAGAGVDVAFVPRPEDMYPPGHQTTVQVHELEQGLCGASRPGHFVGVATVVCKLFNLVQPHVAIFGEKDFQQLAVIRRMVRDLNMPVEIVGLPTVREPDGLAMSSRNRYLSDDQRQRALSLSRALFEARARAAAGQRDATALMAPVRAAIAEAMDRVDYVELRDAESLRPFVPAAAPTGEGTSASVDRPAVLLVAAFIGKTRLIDNIRL